MAIASGVDSINSKSRLVVVFPLLFWILGFCPNLAAASAAILTRSISDLATDFAALTISLISFSVFPSRRTASD